MTGLRNISDVLRRNARKWPSHAAAISEDGVLSFAELDARADAVARGLLACGISAGDVVSVLDGNTLDWMAVCIGANRVGAVLAPISTFSKKDELEWLMRHARTALLIAAPRLLNQDFAAMLRDLLPELEAGSDGTVANAGFADLRRVVSLAPGAIEGALEFEAFLAMGAGLTPERLAEAEAAAQDTAMILYTSGSTAKPKGVEILNTRMVDNGREVGTRMGLTPDDRVFHGGPLFYGMAMVLTLPAAWSHGAAIAFQKSFDAGQALDLIAEHGLTGFVAFNNVTRALIEHERFDAARHPKLKKGVTHFTAADKQLARDVLGVDQCLSVYGLTESHGPCATTDWRDGEEIVLHTQGRPIPGWEFQIVDPQTEVPLPHGETGELHIRGLLSSGYWREPELTEQYYRPDGFYRTGDLARIDDDGRLVYIGRSKEMLKVSGINVSPLDVENILGRIPNVLAAHVVGIPDPVRGEAIAAVLEVEESDLTPQAVRDFVRGSAASYKVPTHVLLLRPGEVPRVASGKAPRNQIAALVRARLDGAPEAGR